MIRIGISIGGQTLLNESFTEISISQGISFHHQIELRLKQDPSRGILADKAKSWIGERITLGFIKEDELNVNSMQNDKHFCGVVTSVVLSRRSGASELIVRGQSTTLLADGEVRTRSFTDKNLQEIVNEVLGSYDIAPNGSLQIAPNVMTESIPYVVQYRESDYQFIHRLASTYGEWFYYDGLNLYFGKPSGGQALQLDLDEKGLIHFDIAVNTAPVQAELGGFDHVKDEQFVERSPASSVQSDLGKIVFDASKGKLFTEVPFSMVGQDIEQDDLKNVVRRREEVAVDELVIFSGSSRHPDLKVGAAISIRDIDLREAYGEYVIIRISHQVFQGGDYLNQFQAVPVEVKTPPLVLLPSSPRCETQIAVVTDVADEKKLGRVKVRFLWQDGTPETSPWLRVASPYTGKDKGFFITPEVDDIVLVAFESDNPEKPYVLSGFYHGKTPPEWFDAKNRYKGFKSKGGNKWKFDDKENSIQVHAPNSILMTAGKTIAIRSGKKDDDSSIVMKEGKEIAVKTNGKAGTTITLDAGEGTVVIKAKKISIEASEMVEVNAGKDVTIDGMAKVAVSGGSKVEVKSVDVKVDGSAKVDTSGAQVSIKGSATVDVKGGLIKLN